MVIPPISIHFPNISIINTRLISINSPTNAFDFDITPIPELIPEFPKLAILLPPITHNTPTPVAITPRKFFSGKIFLI